MDAKLISEILEQTKYDLIFNLCLIFGFWLGWWLIATNNDSSREELLRKYGEDTVKCSEWVLGRLSASQEDHNSFRFFPCLSVWCHWTPSLVWLMLFTLSGSIRDDVGTPLSMISLTLTFYFLLVFCMPYVRGKAYKADKLIQDSLEDKNGVGLAHREEFWAHRGAITLENVVCRVHRFQIETGRLIESEADYGSVIRDEVHCIQWSDFLIHPFCIEFYLAISQLLRGTLIAGALVGILHWTNRLLEFEWLESPKALALFMRHTVFLLVGIYFVSWLLGRDEFLYAAWLHRTGRSRKMRNGKLVAWLAAQPLQTRYDMLRFGWHSLAAAMENAQAEQSLPLTPCASAHGKFNENSSFDYMKN